MKITSVTKPKIGILKADRRPSRGLPRGAAAIEKWIIELGGYELSPKEKACLERGHALPRRNSV